MYFEIGCVTIGKRCDFTGNEDIRNIAINTGYEDFGTWNRCSEQCLMNADCTHWDFLKVANSILYQCRLFNSCVLKDGLGYITGPRNCHSTSLICTLPHIKCDVSDPRIHAATFIDLHLEVGSWEDCGKMCKAQSACQAWNYQSNEHCSLFKGCPRPLSAPGYLKGDRNCPSTGNYQYI